MKSRVAVAWRYRFLHEFAMIKCLPLIFLLTSCGARSRPMTYSDATYLSARPHEIIVQIDSSGMFTTSRSLPLGGDVKITLAGKKVALEKLQQGQRIRIGRDAETRQVVAIEGL